jgi:hypothetical protein
MSIPTITNVWDQLQQQAEPAAAAVAVESAPVEGALESSTGVNIPDTSSLALVAPTSAETELSALLARLEEVVARLEASLPPAPEVAPEVEPAVADSAVPAAPLDEVAEPVVVPRRVSRRWR